MLISLYVSVGEELSLIICKAGKLSIYIGISEVFLYPSSCNNICRYQASLAVVWAEMNLASVELPAVSDWVFDLYIIAPHINMKTRLVVERLLQR